MIQFVIRTGIQKSAKAVGAKRISWLFRDMNWRSTSVPTDEALVLGTMLELAPTNISQIPPKDRMKAIISMVKEFPQRIIFAPGPRFEEEGYRWTLRSFTGRCPLSLSHKMGKVQKAYFPRFGSSYLCLSVSYPGYVLKGELGHNRPWDFILFAGEMGKYLHVKERKSNPQRTHHSGFGDFAHKTTVSPIAVVLHSFLTAKSHSYGAVVMLDEESPGESSHDTSSGIHNGAVDVYVYNVGSCSQVETELGGNIGVECRYAMRTWMLR